MNQPHTAKPETPLKEEKEKKKETAGEFYRSLIYAVLIAMVFRSLAFEPFYIPSGSMIPTLLEGDYVFVSKYSYGYSRYSFPFGLPLFNGRFMESKPERGEVVVFKLPIDPSINYIKRLIGMPGDTIQMIGGILYINGTPIKKERTENYLHRLDDGSVREIPQYVETLPNGVQYRVLDEDAEGNLDTTRAYKVPEGHYFMMGDNRDNSTDSRVLPNVGYVPHENLLGPTNTIFFSLRDPFWKFWNWNSESLRTDRFWSSLEYQHD